MRPGKGRWEGARSLGPTSSKKCIVSDQIQSGVEKRKFRTKLLFVAKNLDRGVKKEVKEKRFRDRLRHSRVRYLSALKKGSNFDPLAAMNDS